MPFSVSNLTQNTHRQLEGASLPFGLTEVREKRVCVNLAAHFLQDGEKLTFTGFDGPPSPYLEIDTEASFENQGRTLLAYLSWHVATALIKDKNLEIQNPAVVTAAREVAAQIGTPAFHDLLDDVVARAGIKVQGEPRHATEVIALGEGRVEIRRSIQWDNASADGTDLGKFKALWAMNCGLNDSNPDRIQLAGGVSQAGVFILDDPHGLRGDALASKLKAPTLFSQFLGAFTQGIAYRLDQGGLKNIDVRLDYATYVAEPQEQGEAAGALQWRGWVASGEAPEAHFTLPASTNVLPSPEAGAPQPLELPERSVFYLANKFEFEYSAEGLSEKQKLIEEDQHALTVLQSEETAATVKFVGESLATRLEQMFSGDDRELFFDRYKDSLKSSMFSYPIPIERPASFDAFVDMLRTHDDPIILLSMIWPVFMAGRGGDGEPMIDAIYAHLIAPTKEYWQDEEKASRPLNQYAFGNSKTIESELFSTKRFLPFVRDIDYKRPNVYYSNKTMGKMWDKRLPYVAGVSGMANLTCKVLDVLNLHPFSPQGKKFCGAMAAFIVGSGMHSYYEANKAFNFYARVLTASSTMDAYTTFSDRMA
ncbi:hypothetical protein [Bordetella sp. 02P26C-1]|uniref:hypothetical protein n=1 Tax=Bordetella sp. 02P26C-1 TaxID=2683195 RepID=UPI001353061A|nr:hypothetical protein [Bordetella sp. 02P26C-1]MVW79757.1 hypothetical protein [Bordetella sp. 02P26C-1]